MTDTQVEGAPLGEEEMAKVRADKHYIPPRAEWGGCAIRGEHEWVHTADTWSIDAKDVTEVVTD